MKSVITPRMVELKVNISSSSDDGYPVTDRIVQDGVFVCSYNIVDPTVGLDLSYYYTYIHTYIHAQICSFPHHID